MAPWGGEGGPEHEVGTAGGGEGGDGSGEQEQTRVTVRAVGRWWRRPGRSGEAGGWEGRWGRGRGREQRGAQGAGAGRGDEETQGWPRRRVARVASRSKTPSRAESRVALNKTESLNIESFYNLAVQGYQSSLTEVGVRVLRLWMAFWFFFYWMFGLIFGTGL